MPAVRRAALQRALEGASGADRRQGIAARRFERSGIGDSGFGWMALGARFKYCKALRRVDLNARESAKAVSDRRPSGRARGALQMRQGIAARRLERSGFGESGSGWKDVGALSGRASNAAGLCGASIRTLGIRRKRFRVGGSRGVLQMLQGIEALRFERSGIGESGFGWEDVGALSGRASNAAGH